MLAAGVVFALVGVAVWWWGSARGRPNAQRERVALLLTAMAPPAFLGLVWVVGADRPEAYLPLGAALVCSMAPVEISRIRVSVQILTGLFFAVMLRPGGSDGPRGPAPVALPRERGGARDRTGEAARPAAIGRTVCRRDAQRRADLLTAVRELPGASLEEAATAACTTMRSLGFDASGTRCYGAGRSSPCGSTGSRRSHRRCVREKGSPAPASRRTAPSSWGTTRTTPAASARDRRSVLRSWSPSVWMEKRSEASWGPAMSAVCPPPRRWRWRRCSPPTSVACSRPIWRFAVSGSS
jgi:hypothetical protein